MNFFSTETDRWANAYGSGVDYSMLGGLLEIGFLYSYNKIPWFSSSVEVCNSRVWFDADLTILGRSLSLTLHRS
jgi:hypothetical protein